MGRRVFCILSHGGREILSFDRFMVISAAMLTTAHVLASVLAVAQPGCSDLSRVYLPFEECGTECLEGHLLMRGYAPSLDFRSTRAVWMGWSVRETYPEGLSRFVTVSASIAFVSNNPPEGWPGTSKELAHTLVTIARHESALWRSVHDGTVRGMAGEKGLFQVHPSVPAFDDCHPGVDRESTDSCVLAAAKMLTSARRLCGTVEGAIAAYGSGQGCEATGDWEEGVAARMGTFTKTFDRRPLPFQATLAMAVQQ